jgi:leucyl aminopeptidase (aminopeptidase T)
LFRVNKNINVNESYNIIKYQFQIFYRRVDKFKDHIMSAIKNNNLVSNVAELGIEKNKSAKNFLKILEAEKIYGTIYMALGSNSSFGGSVRVNFHEDFILFNPNITVTTKSGNVFQL